MRGSIKCYVFVFIFFCGFLKTYSMFFDRYIFVCFNKCFVYNYQPHL